MRYDFTEVDAMISNQSIRSFILNGYKSTITNGSNGFWMN